MKGSLSMKLRYRLLISGAAGLTLSGCGLVSKTLGTVTNTVGGVVQTVTAPVRGVMNAAEPGSEQEWRASTESAAGRSTVPANSKNTRTSHDRRRSAPERRR
jgi:hypothetical protein